MSDLTPAAPGPAAMTPAVAVPPSRPRRRLLWGLLGGLLGLVVALAAAEAAGWPFLAGPLQRYLSQLLERPVRFGAALAPGMQGSDAGASGSPAAAASAGRPLVRSGAEATDPVPAGVRIKLFGGLGVQAQRIEIGAPDWSSGAPLLAAENATLRMRYHDLWQASKGRPLRVRSIEADRLALDLRRLADGRASWQFGSLEASDDPATMPVFEDLRVRAGRLTLVDALTDSQVKAEFSLVEGQPPAGSAAEASAPVAIRSASAASAARRGPATADGPAVAPSGLKVEATGRYRGQPLELSLQSSGLLPWLADDASAGALPLTLRGSVGRARLQFQGRVRDLRRLAGLGGRFSLSGPSLAAVGDLIGVTLPTTAAFTSHGVLAKEGPMWSARVDQAVIGGSKLHAALRYDASQKTPLLAGRVGGSRLLLADLGPVVGTSAPAPQGDAVLAGAKPGRVLPAREFDLPSLRAMNANVLLDFAQLDLGTTRLKPLMPLRAHLRLQDGVLDIGAIDARTSDGRLQGSVSLDGRAPLAVWRSKLRWSQVRLEQWLKLAREPGQPAWITGRLSGLAELEGRGRSTAQILASLSGDLRGQLRNGSVSHLLIEAAGLDLAQGLGVMLKGDDALPMGCALADLRVERGVLRPRAMVLDTRDSVVWIDGSVSLADETLDLRAVVTPKDVSPLALRTPLRVRGTLGDPKVSLEPGPLAGKLLVSGLLALLNPLAALLPLIDLGGSGDETAAAQGCRALVAQAKQLPARSPAR